MNDQVNIALVDAPEKEFYFHAYGDDSDGRVWVKVVRPTVGRRQETVMKFTNRFKSVEEAVEFIETFSSAIAGGMVGYERVGFNGLSINDKNADPDERKPTFNFNRG